MQEFKTKKIIILSLISLSLISLKWFLSFYRFPLEDIDLKIINDIYDQSYFPLIKSFLRTRPNDLSASDLFTHGS